MIQTFNQYQREALRTSQDDLDQEKRLLIAVLGLTGEAGEIANKLKKMYGHGHPFDANVLIDEVGDCLWYLSEIATILYTPLENVAQMNIDKLHKRYPDGFSTEASINRIDHNKDECEWRLVDKEESEYWQTSCDNTHIFFDGCPKDNFYQHCPYCGFFIRDVSSL